jgi:hypothetical protein
LYPLMMSSLETSSPVTLRGRSGRAYALLIFKRSRQPVSGSAVPHRELSLPAEGMAGAQDRHARGRQGRQGSGMKPTLTAAQPNPFEAPDYLARARTFRQAALQLTDMLGHQPNWPKYFLLGHAIELALKAVPKYCQRSRSYQKPSGDEPANHDLVGQYTWAKLHGLPANDIAEEMMPHLSELHLEHFARYPQPLKSVIMISEFDDLVDAILSDVAKFVRAG